MLTKRYDASSRFYTVFDGETGFYMRSGIIDGQGNDTGKDPFMADFPHLVDVGIMGHCEHGLSGKCAKAGTDCYQSGAVISAPNMPLADFAGIAEQCGGRTHQFALGGRGDPDLHEDFAGILRACRERNIVPNYTTSGYRLSCAAIEASKRFCGAVAVSWYRAPYTMAAIEGLAGAGVKTNIHYVLSRQTIGEAVARLETDGFPDGVNAVVFLLYKAAGCGKSGSVLAPGDPDLPRFFEELERQHRFKVGVDSCLAPGVIARCPGMGFEALDACEGARFSCYISADMYMRPCSFDRSRRYAVSLGERSVRDAWHSSEFAAFRAHFLSACPACDSRLSCLGGCALFPDIALCGKRQGLPSA